MPTNLDIYNDVPSRQFKSTYWYRADTWQTADGTAAVRIVNLIYYVSLTVPKTTSFDRLGIDITVAGDAGTKIRLGIYRADTGGFPSERVYGSDQLDGTAATAEVAISQTLQGGRYFLAYVSQGTGTQPTVAIYGAQFSGPYMPEGTSFPTTAGAYIFTEAGGAGAALPATATPALTALTMPKIMIRAL